MSLTDLTEKVAVIDFDGTICRDMFPDVGPIEPDVKAALRLLQNSGYIIKIHSCRTSTVLFGGRGDERQHHIQLITEFMAKHELPYDEIILWQNMNKPTADVYIDDRAVRYCQNWMAIAKALAKAG